MFGLTFYQDLFQVTGPKVRKHLYVSILVGMLSFAMETLSIIVLQGFVVSLGIMSKGQALIPAWYPVDIVFASVALITLGIIRSIVVYLRSISKVVSGNVFMREQRSKLFAYGMQFANIESTQSLINNFSETIYKSSGFVSTVSNLIIAIVSASLLLLACLNLAPFETLFGIIGTVILLVPFYFITRNVNELGKRSAQEIQSVSTTLVTSFKNYFFLKLSNMTESAQYQMDGHLREYELINNKYASVSSLKSAFPYFLGTVVVAIVTLVSFKFYNTESIVLLNFFFLFSRAGNNLSEINSGMVTLRFNHVYVEKLISLRKKIDSFQLLKPDLIKTQKADWAFQSLVLKSVDYSYSDELLVIENLDFELSRGEILLIKGESGVGKSTLISVILGINKPKRGEILLNGKADDQYLEKISAIVGYVGPEPYLITGTVRENLIYGLGKEEAAQVVDQQLWEALEMAQISSLILSFTNKLDEVLNEHVQISTGQRQRLSIARAFVKRPQILIFDEATANLDKTTEKKIIEQLIKLSSKGTANILISHKDSFNSISDKNILMEKGSSPVVQLNEGKHEIQIH
jgi:ABC-type multidrug transport system fused ATPase/permease subunit